MILLFANALVFAENVCRHSRILLFIYLQVPKHSQELNPPRQRSNIDESFLAQETANYEKSYCQDAVLNIVYMKTILSFKCVSLSLN